MSNASSYIYPTINFICTEKHSTEQSHFRFVVYIESFNQIFKLRVSYDRILECSLCPAWSENNTVSIAEL